MFGLIKVKKEKEERKREKIRKNEWFNKDKEGK